MADEFQLQSDEFWQQHPDIRARVQCTSRKQHFNIGRAGRSWPVYHVDPRGGLEAMDRDFEEAVRYILPILEDGYDVVVHCAKSFHRAPVVTAKIMQYLSGVSPAV